MSQNSRADEAVSDLVEQNVEAIAAMHARAERRAHPTQRLIETLINSVGRPLFLAIMLAFTGGWIFLNRVGSSRASTYDPPPYNRLQFILTIVALFISIMILIKQNRQDKLAERRSQLDLQISLVTEQKIAKLIALVEELRRDMPNVPDRHDPVANAMQESAHPHDIATALDRALQDTVFAEEEVVLDNEAPDVQP